jgi:hypothetical protein
VASSAEARVRALERAIATAGAERRCYSFEQLVRLSYFLSPTGTFPGNPDALVGPPADTVRPGQRTALDKILAVVAQ